MFDILLTQGFLHLAEDIFELLDNVSLGHARSVCQKWKWVIEKFLTHGNMLHSTHCMNVLCGTMQTRLLR